MLKPKVGDLVRLEPLKVDGYNSAEEIRLLAPPYYFNVAVRSVEEILLRPLAVGDRAVLKTCFGGEIDRRGTILAIHNDKAWFLSDDIGVGTFLVAELTRIDDPA